MIEIITSERPEIIEKIRAEVRGVPYRPAKRLKAAPQPPDPETCRHLFTVETGNRWLELGEREPTPKMLFGEFWHQGELCILFADTNVGKSVLAVQIGNSIARGQPIAPFALGAEPTRVLYIDFELSVTQFYQRYTHAAGDYTFPYGFLRAQFNADNMPAGNNSSYDDHVIAGIECKIKQVGARVLIIDNISCLRGGTENAAVALTLMKNLKALKADYNLSILVLAHTPKRRNPAAPLTADDLHGSKLLINLADSAFAIGTSAATPNLRYLKQIKQRSTAQVYGQDNVCLCRIAKPGNFLQMEFEGNSAERPHLRTRQLNQQILAPKVAHLAANGYSQRRISKELCVAVGLVNKLIER
ncbi:AAA family ATPase [Mucilaginibacter sp. 14171R-50]|uniref:AAA family ATPase n=1 Tax=Mucilaginibacter sp. 14171R-50 TaxID=2703789 RepID=UPI00138CBEF5|nr:AAA family ATPase [Mucilaginibacter sp. 14171R-50]QHS55714.1 AAA family ATPase [Mucilaginibacter sp. 14171R-50]